MFLARREFGKVARVYEVMGDPFASPVFGMFIPRLGDEAGRRLSSKLCGPGCWATGRTHREALNTLHMHEEAAHEELFYTTRFRGIR